MSSKGIVTSSRFRPRPNVLCASLPLAALGGGWPPAEETEGHRSLLLTPPAPVPPALVGSIPAQLLVVGEAATLDGSTYFPDPAGGTLLTPPLRQPPPVVSISQSGSTLTMVGVSAATVTVTAVDPDGLTATRSAAVTVAAGSGFRDDFGSAESLSDWRIVLGDAVISDGHLHVTSAAEGLGLAVQGFGYSLTSWKLRVRMGRAQPGGFASAWWSTGHSRYEWLSFDIGRTANGNNDIPAPEPRAPQTSGGLHGRDGFAGWRRSRSRGPPPVETGTGGSRDRTPRRTGPPQAVGEIQARTVPVDGAANVDVSSYFRDPDGDVLSYTAASSNSGNRWRLGVGQFRRGHRTREGCCDRHRGGARSAGSHPRAPATLERRSPPGVFRFTEGWYNPRRRHSSLGYESPATS